MNFLKAHGLVRESVFDWEMRERGKLRWRSRFRNLRTIAGANYLLGAGFKSGTVTPITTWYLGLISDADDVAVDENDTMASHAGWTEFQSYGGGARPAWSLGTPAGAVLTFTARTTFTLSANGSIRGLFLNSVNTLGGTLGTLYSAGLDDMARLVLNGNTLDVGYDTSIATVG